MNKDFNKYSGMTLNERLYKSGLLDEYEKLTKLRDKNSLVEILKKVGLNEKDASWSAEKSIDIQTRKQYFIGIFLILALIAVIFAVIYAMSRNL